MSGEFEIHYQPIVQARNPDRVGVIAFESLIRWRRSVGDLLGPLEFLGSVVRNGLSREVGDWTVRRVIRDARQLQIDGEIGSQRFYVNAFSNQLEDENFPVDVCDTLSAKRLHASMFGVEIHEKSLFSHRAAHSNIEAMQKCNIYVSLDDFGAGNAHVSALGLPFDVIKIDKAYTKNIADAESQERLRHLLALARGRKRFVIAEGVETLEQAQFLNSIGCHWHQGWLYAGSMRLGEVVSYMRRCYLRAKP